MQAPSWEWAGVRLLHDDGERTREGKSKKKKGVPASERERASAERGNAHAARFLFHLNAHPRLQPPYGAYHLHPDSRGTCGVASEKRGACGVRRSPWGVALAGSRSPERECPSLMSSLPPPPSRLSPPATAHTPLSSTPTPLTGHLYHPLHLRPASRRPGGGRPGRSRGRRRGRAMRRRSGAPARAARAGPCAAPGRCLGLAPRQGGGGLGPGRVWDCVPGAAPEVVRACVRRGKKRAGALPGTALPPPLSSLPPPLARSRSLTSSPLFFSQRPHQPRRLRRLRRGRPLQGRPPGGRSRRGRRGGLRPPRRRRRPRRRRWRRPRRRRRRRRPGLPRLLCRRLRPRPPPPPPPRRSTRRTGSRPGPRRARPCPSPLRLRPPPRT